MRSVLRFSTAMHVLSKILQNLRIEATHSANACVKRARRLCERKERAASNGHFAGLARQLTLCIERNDSESSAGVW